VYKQRVGFVTTSILDAFYTFPLRSIFLKISVLLVTHVDY